MRPGEQLSWALVAITVLAALKWLFAAVLFVRPQVIQGVSPWVLPMILVAGICSLRLIDTSQPLSALFGIVAAAYSTSPICAADFDCTRFQLGAFLPVVFWAVAATVPEASSVWIRRAALVVAAFGLAVFVTLLAGFDPFFWPAVFEPAYRVWEWAAAASLAGLVVFRLQSGRLRLSRARARTLLIAFGPPLAFLAIDSILQMTGILGEETSPGLTLVVAATNLSLGWGIFTLTRAEIARHKESRHEAEHRKPHRL